jgi:uncharacterized membrane protein YfcA
MSTIELALLVLAGFLGGFLNTVASSGSAITLPAMIFIGIAPGVANATNRVALLLGFILAAYKYHKAGLVNWKRAFSLAPMIVIGTIIGTQLVDELNDSQVKTLLAFALVISISLIILRPNTFKDINANLVEKPIRFWAVVSTVLIGIWGGLIVLDVGTLLLVAFSLQQGLNLQQANVQKAIQISFIAGVSLIIFQSKAQVNWIAALFLSVGSILGSYLGTQFTINPSLKKWIYRVLVATIGFEIANLIFNEFLDLFWK